MFGNHKEIEELEKDRLEHQKELRKDRNARYYRKHKDDEKVRKARETLDIYDKYQEKPKEVPGFMGY